MRWLWWRVTAWTELGCMLAAGAATITMHFRFNQVEFPFTLLVIVPVALLGAAIGTFAFAPEPSEVLLSFVGKVRPPGPGWRRLRMEHGAPKSGAASTSLLRPTICWVLSTASIYCALFGVGDLLLKSKLRGACLCALAAGLAIAVGKVYRLDGASDDRPARHGV